MTIISLEKLLNSTSPGSLETLVQKAQEMDRLTSALRRKMPANLSDNIVAASIRDGSQLVVIASSSAWASKLRFEERELIEAANAAGASVDCCRVTVSRIA